MAENRKIKYSIITVSYNSETFIEETIKSVLEQTYTNVEYIIIDGNSTDNTVEIVNKYINKIHYFISEPDNGMYDAINKGIKQSSGDYILILNSDDYLSDNTTISKINEKVQHKNLNFFYCNILRKHNESYRKIKLRKYNFLNVLCSLHCTFIPHPSFFISKIFIQQHSLTYNLKYKYASDFDYILFALKNSSQKQYTHIKLFSTVFREHPNSITSSGKIDKERKQVLEQWSLYKINFLYRKYLYYKNWIQYKIYN